MIFYWNYYLKYSLTNVLIGKFSFVTLSENPIQENIWPRKHMVAKHESNLKKKKHFYNIIKFKNDNMELTEDSASLSSG